MNDELGFNLLKTEGHGLEYNTRGNQYISTCARELYFCEKVNEALKKLILLVQICLLGFVNMIKSCIF